MSQLWKDQLQFITIKIIRELDTQTELKHILNQQYPIKHQKAFLSKVDKLLMMNLGYEGFVIKVKIKVPNVKKLIMLKNIEYNY